MNVSAQLQQLLLDRIIKDQYNVTNVAFVENCGHSAENFRM